MTTSGESEHMVGIILHDNTNPIPMIMVGPKPGSTVDGNVRRTLARGSDAEIAEVAFVDFPKLDATDEQLAKAGRVLTLAVNANGNSLSLPENRPATGLVTAFSDGALAHRIVGEAILCVRDRETNEIHALPDALAHSMLELFDAVTMLSGILGSGAEDGGSLGFGFPLSPN